jgi:S1-C subfamily serine protease/HEAT repeat protein
MNDHDFFDDGEVEPPENRDGLMLGIFMGAGMGILLLAAAVFFFIFKSDEKDPNIAQNPNENAVAQNSDQDDQSQTIAQNTVPKQNSQPQNLDQGVAANNSTQPAQPAVVEPKSTEPEQPVPDEKNNPPVEPAPVNPAPVKPAPEVKPAPKIIKPEIAGERIAYKWTTGEIHSYTLKMVVDQGGTKQIVTGTIDLTVGAPVKAEQQPNKAESTEGSGTGFVATSDGYIVTCAHVVKDATKIEVHLDGKIYRATVVATEPNDDLAVIKIDAKDLKVLSLAKADEVQLAQQIRNIGFPLSNVLGDGLKITAGVISGVVQRDGRKRFQIDAAVNPGNSGGPVVNLRGEVVGVASSKLVGLEIDKVGFCVPSDAVEAFLKKHKIQALIKQGAKQDLDGPKLFQMAKPALALLKVTINPTQSLGKLVQIATSGRYSTKLEQPGRRIIGLGGMTQTSRGILTVDQYGQVEKFEDSNQLPFLTGPMSLLAVHSLDPEGRNQWTVRQNITITIEQEDRRFGGRGRRPFGPRFRIPDPFGRNEANVKKHIAVEETRYVLKEKTDKTLVIAKQFSLKTQDDPNNPLMAITGSGTITFDLQDGLVKDYEFKQTYENRAGGNRVVVPITISMNRVPAAEFADRIRKMADTLALGEAQRSATAKKVPQKTDPEKLDEVLNKIKEAVARNRNPWSTISGLNKLVVIPERKEEVAALLVTLLQSQDKTQLKYALEALAKWGTKASVPDIVPHLKNTFFTIPQAAANALGEIGDTRAIDPLIEAVKTNGRNRRYLANGLKKFGPQIEDRVIELLASEDKSIMQTACEILKGVGGKKSIEALTPLVKGSDFFRRIYAEQALKPIQARVDLIGDEPGDPNTSPIVRRIDAIVAKLQSEGINDLERIQLLSKLVSEKVVEERKLVVEKELLKLLGSTNGSLKLQALMAIKKWATKASVPTLVKLAVADGALSVIALDAMTNVADESISDQVVDLALKEKTRLNAMNLLTKIGLNEAAETKLSAALPKADVKFQSQIIGILGLHGSNECLKSLELIASSNTPTVTMKAAATAAARIRLRSDSVGNGGG